MRACLPWVVMAAMMATVISGATATTSLAAAITPGNIVVYRVGDGTAGLTTTAAAVFLDEYNASGTLVQTFPVPTTGASQMVAIGNSTTEGIISRSQDGTKFVFTGYRASTGSAPGGASPNFTPRVFGTLDVSGSLNTSFAVTDATSAVPRSATTVDGSAFWVATSTGLRYVGTPSASSSSILIDPRNSRQVNLDSNTLFASNGSTAVTAKVQSYGTLPTASTTPTAVVSLLSTDAVNGFTLLDLDAGIAGPDTLYGLVTNMSQLRKYSFDGTNWLSNGSLSTTAVNVAATNVGGAVTLYLTTGPKLQVLNDTSGFNATLAGTITDLATAATNTAFRGVGVVAVPEPSTWVAGASGLAWAAWTVVRRRRSGE